MAVFEAVDSRGKKLEVGDIVEVTVKYRVLQVYDQHVLAEKVYDVPSKALTKTTENIKETCGCDHSTLGD